MILESAKHATSSFVTLTYNAEKLPVGSTLEPKHVQRWIKRLRKAIYPDKIRYYLAGEYGDGGRPHYHAAVFGLDPITGGGDDGCKGVVQETWGQGHTFVGDLSPQSASYICKYTTKDIGKNKKYYESLGLHPPFSRMSLKPEGIGASAMKDVASAIENYHSEIQSQTGSPISSFLQLGKKKVYIGPYLKSKLRQSMGYGRKTTDEEKQTLFENMRQLFENEKYAAKKEARPIKYKEEFDKQKILNIESRFKIKNSKESL